MAEGLREVELSGAPLDGVTSQVGLKKELSLQNHSRKSGPSGWSNVWKDAGAFSSAPRLLAIPVRGGVPDGAAQPPTTRSQPGPRGGHTESTYLHFGNI